MSPLKSLFAGSSARPTAPAPAAPTRPSSHRSAPSQGAAVCPYCRAPVAHPPKYKAICARCGQTYFARIRPGESRPTLVTARQAAAVDENRATRPRWEQLPTPAEQVEERTFNWFWTFSSAEGQWRRQKRALKLHTRDGNWLLYRNARFEMAEIRRKQARLRDALELYLEVWYFDLNGPQDCWGVVSARRLYESAPFDAARGLTTPVVARWANRIAVRLHLDTQLLERQFVDIALRLYQTHSLPLTPREAWAQVAKEIVV